MEAGKMFITRNDQAVMVTRNTVEHMRAHPISTHLIDQAFKQLIIESNNEWFVGTAEFGRVIGRSGCVQASQIDADSPALFAFRKGRKFASRCQRGEGSPTEQLTVVARRQGHHKGWILVSAWCGPAAKPEPANLNQKENLAFWCENALVWNDESFVEEPRISTWRDVLTRKKA